MKKNYFFLKQMIQVIISHRKSVAETSKETISKENSDFQVGRDLIEEESAEENRVKTEIYIYYAKSVGTVTRSINTVFIIHSQYGGIYDFNLLIKLF